jgi:type VI protein secretion system component VasF
MSISTPFTLPYDYRWRDAQRYHHILSLVKSVILALFITLVITHYIGFMYSFKSRSQDEDYIAFS